MTAKPPLGPKLAQCYSQPLSIKSSRDYHFKNNFRSGFQPVRTQSNRFDNRRRSERNNEMGPPRGLPRNRNQTHDGRMDKKKLSPEEVNEINQEVSHLLK